MMEGEEECNTILGLGLSIGEEFVPKREQRKGNKSTGVGLELSFSIDHLKKDEDESIMFEEKAKRWDSSKKIDENNENGDGNYCSRKKLRLTKDQYILLEDSFKLHTNLNPVQKQTLVERLNLQPRQIEVWFQNRRARTKLKKTEKDCEFLKKCCKSLSEENQRLKKELHELLMLKQIASAAQLYIQLPKPAATTATLTTCPACEEKSLKKPMMKVYEYAAGAVVFGSGGLHQTNKSQSRSDSIISKESKIGLIGASTQQVL